MFARAKMRNLLQNLRTLEVYDAYYSQGIVCRLISIPYEHMIMCKGVIYLSAILLYMIVIPGPVL